MQILGYFGFDAETLRSEPLYSLSVVLLFKFKISSFYLSSLTLLAGLCWTLLEIAIGFLVLSFPGKCTFP